MRGDKYIKDGKLTWLPTIDTTVKPPATEHQLCSYDTARRLFRELGCPPDEVNAFERLADALAPARVTITTREVKEITLRYDTKRGNEVEVNLKISSQ